MPRHSHFSDSQRPPWMPDREEWHSRRWQMARGKPFFRRMGCLFLLFSFFAFTGIFTFIGFIVSPFIEIHNTSVVGRLTAVFPVGLAGMLILAVAVFWGVRSLRRMSMPLDELLEASKRVADGDYAVRVEERGTPEVRSLTKGFNSMTERLEVNEKQRRHMLADISHELRSPITIMQGNLEGMIDGVYVADVERLKSLFDETQFLARLVDDLRTLALAESGSLRLKREPTDLNLLIRETVAGFEVQAQAKAIHLELELSDDDAIEIDPLRIREVVRNLLTNALRYTPSQGVVKVGVTESGTGVERGVLVYVQDSGAGIEPADLPHVFERFYKSSDSGGMGLGLSIARYLVEAHGGRIWAESEVASDGEARRGTRISFWLPIFDGSQTR